MKLKNLAVTTVGLMGLGTFANAGPAAPESVPPAPPAPMSSGLFDEFGAELSFGYDSNYIFRGVDYGENLVWTGLDLAVPLTQGSQPVELNLGAWYASLADTAYDELNLLAGLGTSIGGFDVGLGYMFYYFPMDSSDANEVGLTVGRSVNLGAALGLDIGAGAYYDFETEGWYWEAAVETEFEISEHVSLVPGALISWADSYYGISGGNHVALTLKLPIQLTPTATLTPYIAGNLPYDKLDDAGEDDQVYGGVSLSISF
jgi:hypothetical protein